MLPDPALPASGRKLVGSMTNHRIQPFSCFFRRQFNFRLKKEKLKLPMH